MGVCNSKKPGTPDALAPTLMETGANEKNQPKPASVEKQSADEQVVDNGAPPQVAEVSAGAQHAGNDQTCQALEGRLEESPSSPPASPFAGLRAPANSPQSPQATPSPRVGPDSAMTPARATEGAIA